MRWQFLLGRRVAQPDSVQLLTLLFALLLFVLLVGWPAGPGSPNDAWFALAPTRLLALTLLGLGLGAAAEREGARERLVTAALPPLFALLTTPFEVATLAATFPRTDLMLPVVTAPLDALASFGLGLLLALATRWARIPALLPLLIPGLVAALVLIDARLGRGLLNPLAAATNPSLAHTLVSTAAALLTVGLLLRAARRAG